MDEYPQPAQAKSKKAVYLFIGIGVVVVVLLLAGLYTGFLGARVAPGVTANVTGPEQLIAGQPVVVTWDMSTEAQQSYPSGKIEFCQGQLFGDRCVTLNADTPNDGEALVFVPNLVPVDGYLRLTARSQPGGSLLSQVTITRPVSVVAGDRTTLASIIAPANVGGGAISTLTAAGPRVGAERGGTYTVVLPEPSALKKVEVCVHGVRCYPVAVSVQGASAQIRIPNIPVGSKAYLKVSERGADGLLTGREFYRRALLISAAQPRPSQPPFEDNIPPEAEPPVTPEPSFEPTPTEFGLPPEESLEPTPTEFGLPPEESPEPTPTEFGLPPEESPEPTPTEFGLPVPVEAMFVVPVDDEVIAFGNPLDVRVWLIETDVSKLTCQEWLLDGVPIMPSQWEDGQSPDLSAETCQ